MKKRFISIILAVLTVLTMTLCLSGCKKVDDNFPVTIGHTEIPDRPKNVAVLSDNLADIILYMDEFESQICAISDSCTQTDLTKYLESVGSETNPSIDDLERSGAEYVLTDTPLSDKIIEKLESKGMTVLNFMVPENDKQLQTIYNSLGTFFGGKPDGKQTADAAYSRLFTTLEAAVKETEGSNIVKVACYLYLNEEGKLCTFNGSDCNGMVLDYIGAVNVASNFGSELVDTSILALSKPDYIFFDDPEVLNFLRSDEQLSKLSAVKENRTLMIPKENLERMGETLIETQKSMLGFIYDIIPNGEVTPDEADAKSYAEDYGITITDTMYQYLDDAEDIKIIQQRLMDLGYLVLEDNTPTTYFGQKTETAVRDFQDANGIESTGIVNRTTLNKLFLSTTLSVTGQPVEPPKKPATTPEATEPTNPSSSLTPSNDPNKTYDIDLTLRKDFEVNYDEGFEDVRVIQERLHDLGFFTPEEDYYTNIYGNQTAESFKLFEAANGLEVDGIASYEDLLVLFPNNNPNQ
ncbi:MAG: peptidoglycan-binding protein [Ruminococcus sp.]|nr:peptidoglycan-binding protein [Ruminococcus sp.]